MEMWTTLEKSEKCLVLASPNSFHKTLNPNKNPNNQIQMKLSKSSIVFFATMTLADATGTNLRTVPAVAAGQGVDVQATFTSNSTFTPSVEKETQDKNNNYDINIIGGEVSDPGEFPYYGAFLFDPSFIQKLNVCKYSFMHWSFAILS